MGRPKKPAIIRRAEGNRGHRPIANEIAGIGRPQPPASLTKAQRERWDEIVASLPDEVMTSADVATIERMAIAWAAYREATLEINNAGLLVPGPRGQMRHPLLLVRKQAAEEMQICGMSLGLSPVARAGLIANDNDTDFLAALAASPTTTEAVQ